MSTKTRTQTRTLRGLLGILLGVAVALPSVACNPVITTRVATANAPVLTGISIPIPPPSLHDYPVQSVDLEGELDDTEGEVGGDDVAIVFLEEHRTNRGYFVEADKDGLFTFPEINLDLSDNCIEVHYEVMAEREEDDVLSKPAFYTATIGDDDRTVVLEPLKGSCE